MLSKRLPKLGTHFGQFLPFLPFSIFLSDFHKWISWILFENKEMALCPIAEIKNRENVLKIREMAEMKNFFRLSYV